jgi:hypothetical protein
MRRLPATTAFCALEIGLSPPAWAVVAVFLERQQDLRSVDQ